MTHGHVKERMNSVWGLLSNKTPVLQKSLRVPIHTPGGQPTTALWGTHFGSLVKGTFHTRLLRPPRTGAHDTPQGIGSHQRRCSNLIGALGTG